MSNYQNIFDSHAHYDDERFRDNQDDTISHIHENGVCAVMNIACDLESCETSIALAEKYPFFYCSVGIHPHDAQGVPAQYLDKLKQYAAHPKVKAIGEIGLDYHYDFSPRDKQKKIFEQQLILAQELSLPVIIHSREASADTMELLKKHRPKGVVHCFSGSAETAEEVVKLGMYIGFTGVVTFKGAKKALRAVEAVPPDRLLLETDCPYMAPVPHRGKTCTSDMIPFTAEKIAAVKGLDAQELIDLANRNTKQCFGIT